ncbi:hypothetical protein [Azospirillum halopraeferens]|uniref:hypothetical protein n=1 Tax=Azospirillum halopraeferens TaxID=34010 RepID=UPI000421131B|nr:hypothetical protein [Azospirillum halopraeferens]
MTDPANPDPRTDRRPPGSAGRPISAEKARGGRIILNTPARRAVFIGGLVGFVLLTFLGLVVA